MITYILIAVDLALLIAVYFEGKKRGENELAQFYADQKQKQIMKEDQRIARIGEINALIDQRLIEKKLIPEPVITSGIGWMTIDPFPSPAPKKKRK